MNLNATQCLTPQSTHNHTHHPPHFKVVRAMRIEIRTQLLWPAMVLEKEILIKLRHKNSVVVSR